VDCAENWKTNQLPHLTRATSISIEVFSPISALGGDIARAVGVGLGRIKF
jgi:hypothetical protein